MIVSKTTSSLHIVTQLPFCPFFNTSLFLWILSRTSEHFKVTNHRVFEDFSSWIHFGFPNLVFLPPGKELKLHCPVHQRYIPVSKSKDFDLVRDGGCWELCGQLMPCGHSCRKLCHALDREHSKYKCQEPCDRYVHVFSNTKLCQKANHSESLGPGA